ncbi:BnaC09g51440D [Brassica napus]|uniref:BnaC09g51440D protein n=1 Tax=Brassica napus TaxID=3708 RepID=A0A078IS49_BRANA|nr:BnaC09g51440D [Brassica napus]
MASPFSSFSDVGNIAGEDFLKWFEFN